MWGLPGPGLEPMSPELLAGRFFTTELPGKPLLFIFLSVVPQMFFVSKKQQQKIVFFWSRNTGCAWLSCLFYCLKKKNSSCSEFKGRTFREKIYLATVSVHSTHLPGAARVTSVSCLPGDVLYFLKSIYFYLFTYLGFPDSSTGKESACNAGDLGSIPGLRRSPGEGKGYPLQYSGLGNSMDCIVSGVAKSRTRLNDFHRTSVFTYLAMLVLVATFGIRFPDQGLNPCPLHWEVRVLATGPPGKSQYSVLKQSGMYTLSPSLYG